MQKNNIFLKLAVLVLLLFTSHSALTMHGARNAEYYRKKGLRWCTIHDNYENAPCKQSLGEIKQVSVRVPRHRHADLAKQAEQERRQERARAEQAQIAAQQQAYEQTIAELREKQRQREEQRAALIEQGREEELEVKSKPRFELSRIDIEPFVIEGKIGSLCADDVVCNPQYTCSCCRWYPGMYDKKFLGFLPHLARDLLDLFPKESRQIIKEAIAERGLKENGAMYSTLMYFNLPDHEESSRREKLANELSDQFRGKKKTMIIDDLLIAPNLIVALGRFPNDPVVDSLPYKVFGERAHITIAGTKGMNQFEMLKPLAEQVKMGKIRSDIIEQIRDFVQSYRQHGNLPHVIICLIGDYSSPAGIVLP